MNKATTERCTLIAIQLKTDKIILNMYFNYIKK